MGENRPLFFGLDTGANKTHIGSAIFKKLGIEDIKMKKEIRGSAGGFVEAEVERLENLELMIGDNHIRLNDISSSLMEPASFFKLDGILGIDICPKGSMIIDYFNGSFELKLPASSLV